MHISSIALTNVRQFAQETFDFQPGFNLIVGENGAGKTAILRALFTVVSGPTHAARGQILNDDDIRHTASYLEVRAVLNSEHGPLVSHFQKHRWEDGDRQGSKAASLVLFYSSTEAACASFSSPKRKGPTSRRSDDLALRRNLEHFYREERREIRRSGKTAQFGSSDSIRPFLRQVLRSFSDTFSDFTWNFEPYSCSVRLLRQDKNLELNRSITRRISDAVMQYIQRRNPNLQFAWPDRKSVTVDFSGHLVTKDEKQRRQVLPEISGILRNFKFSSDEVSLISEARIDLKLAPQIFIRRGDIVLRLSQLSDGEKRLFSLFADVARNLSLQRTDAPVAQRNALILIDEIDVHLHPKWQRKVIPVLEDLFPRCQFIATTHSPFVIQATSRRKITSIDPAVPINYLDGGNSIEDIAEEIQGVPVPQRSQRSEALSQAAQRYFTLLKQEELNAQSVTRNELATAERDYRNASEPFTAEPAVHALLKVQLMEAKQR